MTKKEQRLAVFNKNDGHCAYCGQAIKLNGFEVDHIEALYRNDEWGGSDTLDNMNPACRKCNRSKSTFTIEKWREQLHNKVKILNRDSATYNMAKRFGLVQETDAVIQFYYERFEKLHLQNVSGSCVSCHYSNNGAHGCNRLMDGVTPKIDKSKGVECAHNGYVHYLPFKHDR